MAAAVRLVFTDGTTLQLDTWIGNFRPKPNGKYQNDRQLAYLTAMAREVDGLALMPDELKVVNNTRLGKQEKKSIKKRLKTLIDRRN
jgi:hypothetical protein